MAGSGEKQGSASEVFQSTAPKVQPLIFIRNPFIQLEAAHYGQRLRFILTGGVTGGVTGGATGGVTGGVTGDAGYASAQAMSGNDYRRHYPVGLLSALRLGIQITEVDPGRRAAAHHN